MGVCAHVGPNERFQYLKLPFLAAQSLHTQPHENLANKTILLMKKISIFSVLDA